MFESLESRRMMSVSTINNDPPPSPPPAEKETVNVEASASIQFIAAVMGNIRETTKTIAGNLRG